MIRRIDNIATELRPPSDPDPAGAQAVQELLGGRFGEMSTFLNSNRSISATDKALVRSMT